MLKILQARLQEYVHHELPDFQAGSRTVKGFSLVNEAEVDIFLKFPCFVYNPLNVGNLISSSSAYSKPRLYTWNSSVHILLKPSLKDFEHKLTSM